MKPVALVDLLGNMSEDTRRRNEARLRELGRPTAPARETCPPPGRPASRPATEQAPATKPAGRASKYGNVATEGPAPWGGSMPYPSRTHARYAERLAAEKAAGVISAWSPEVSLIIGRGPRGYRRHKVDFVAVEGDGRLRLVEVKGFGHADGERRRADVEAMGFVVEVVR